MIEAIENSAYAIWVRESPSIFAYTSILSLHAIGLAIIVGINVLIGLRLLGFVKEIPLAPMRKLFPWMYLGFAVNVFSGGSLLAANMSNNLSNWLFIVKLVFIALAMVNLELTKMYVFDKPGPVDAAGVPKHGRVFAVSAMVLWGVAMVAGRFTAYPNFVEAWLGF